MIQSRSTESERRTLIGIGASAGGLEALSSFISHLPIPFPHPIIIAQHLAPHGKSMLVELLSKQSALPVMPALDGEKLKNGCIFIVPPNCNVRVSLDKMYLDVSETERRPIPSIDDFFSSLASQWKENAVGIILSGTGSDGAHGIRAIHAAGGLTFAQDGFSAKYDGMPQAAIDTSCIDAILSPEEMARTLLDLLQDHHTGPEQHLLETPEWQSCLQLLEQQTGTDYSLYKPSTLQRRLWRRMVQVRLSDLGLYLEFLKRTPGEVMALSHQLLVSVTSFFRDAEVFTELKNQLTDIILKKRHGDELRIWVAGCATGEEAYSLAMLTWDILEQNHRSLSVKIFATDLDQDAIAEGRKGVYDAEAVHGVPALYLAKYFEKLSSGRWEIKKKIRDAVVFARQDMIQNPPFVRLDLVTCRNVLIYFEPELQKKVLEVFHYALASGGLLCLGKAETPGSENSFFEAVDKKLKIYRKLDVASSLRMNRFSAASLTEYIPAKRRAEAGPSMLERGLLCLLKEYRHCGVIVDRDLNVIQVLGDISDYASFSASQSDSRLISLLPKPVGIELPILLKKAADGNETCHSRWYAGNSGKVSEFRLAVRTLAPEGSRDARGPLFLIDFEARSRDEASVPPKTLTEGDLPAHVLEVEQELYATREHLQTVIEELGVANEELQSLNEELSSTNEELQSTNEELETANEELQSGNEELTTVNEELNMKTQLLRDTNISLENIQESIGAGLVVLDKEGRIMRYNEDAKKIFVLSAADIGKPIVRVSARCELPEFEKRIFDTIQEGKSSEGPCEGADTVYQLRCQPFIDERAKIVGAILVFIDETAITRTRERLVRSETQLRSILESFSGPVSLKDQHGRYLLANTAFAEFFGLEESAILGQTDQDLFGDRRATSLRDLDLEVMVRGETLRQIEELTGAHGEVRSLLTNRFPLYERRGAAPYAVGMVAVDVTSQLEAQGRLAESEARYRSIIEDQAVFVCRLNPDGEILYANNLFEIQFSEDRKVGEGDLFHKFVAHQDFPRVQSDLATLSKREPILQTEYRVFRKNGTTRWIRWIFKGIFSAASELTEIQAIGFDITEYRTKTDLLLEKEAIFSKVLRNTSDLVSILRRVGDEFVAEYYNLMAEQVIGPEVTVLGKTLAETRDPDYVQRVQEKFFQALRTNEPVSFEDVVRYSHKDIYLAYTVVPLRSASVTDGVDRVAVICKDISSYKAIEQDLRLAKESAEVANEAKSDFLASMSHELRTPLNVVLGMATLLSETSLSAEQQAFVGSIDRSGKALLSLIEDILDISKIESGKIKLNAEAFDIAELLRETVRMFELPAQGKGLELKVDIDPKARELVTGDPGRLRQIIVNLIGNALKFTDRGSVRVTLRAGDFSYAGEKEFHFEVQDTGIGIKTEDREKIFQKFSQVESGHSRRYGGSGLGLVISKQFAEMMRGQMGFTSQEGRGSRFWFSVRLLLASQNEITARTSRQKFVQKNTAQGPRSLKVLAVDDNRESLNIIRLFLNRLGQKTFVASSAKEAMEKIKEEHIDLVFMDVQMPETDGYEATKMIRQDPEIATTLPIIALTANAMAGDAEKCLKSGMNDYLTKPIRLETLKEILGRWSLYVEQKES